MRLRGGGTVLLSIPVASLSFPLATALSASTYTWCRASLLLYCGTAFSLPAPRKGSLGRRYFPYPNDFRGRRGRASLGNSLGGRGGGVSSPLS